MSSLKKSLLNFPAIESGFFDRRYRRAAIIAASSWFFVCLLWTAPATLLASLLKSAAPQLELQTVEGSFWHGHASAAFWKNGTQRFALGAVEWQLSPWSLLWLHPGAHITTNYGPQLIDARVRLSPLGSLQLRDVRATIPVTGLAAWLPMPVDGLIGLKLPRAEFARRDLQLRELQGEIQWQQAAWQWNSNWVALGDYTGVVEMKEATQVHAVVKGGSELVVSGDVTANLKDKNYALQMLLTPAATLPQELRDGMAMFLGSTRDAQGRLQVKRDGKW